MMGIDHRTINLRDRKRWFCKAARDQLKGRLPLDKPYVTAAEDIERYGNIRLSQPIVACATVQKGVDGDHDDADRDRDR